MFQDFILIYEQEIIKSEVVDYILNDDYAYLVFIIKFGFSSDFAGDFIKLKKRIMYRNSYK